MPVTQLTLLTKPGCHLCDIARQIVEQVVAEIPDAASVEIIERSILHDPQLDQRYAEQIPVVLIDDRVHTIWRVDAARLRDALTKG